MKQLGRAAIDLTTRSPWHFACTLSMCPIVVAVRVTHLSPLQLALLFALLVGTMLLAH